MMGRSHGIHGEPITFGIKVAGWYTEMGRAIDRLKQARDVAAVGKLSGAMGTFAHLDPSVEAYVCRSWVLKGNPWPRRWFRATAMRNICAIWRLWRPASSASRRKSAICSARKCWKSKNPFPKAKKASSAMPHKRNPIACENLCGLARLIRGYAQACAGKCGALA